MEHREILNLIFLRDPARPKKKVTDVSGRGVGMDVVRTNIRKINGSVDLESEPGKGSQIIIKLPLTIAIIQALMVEVERSIFRHSIEHRHRSRSHLALRDQNDQWTRGVVPARPRAALIVWHEFDIPTDSNRERFYVVVAALGDRQVGWSSMSFDPRRKW